VEHHIPYPIDEVLFDYKIIGREEGKSKVLLVAVRKDSVNNYLEILKEAGLKPISLGLSSLSLFKFCLKTQHFLPKKVLFINLDSNQLELAAFLDEALQWSRKTSLRSETLLHATLDSDTSQKFLEEIKKTLHLERSSQNMGEVVVICNKGGHAVQNILREELKVKVHLLKPSSILSNTKNLPLLSAMGLAYTMYTREAEIDLLPFKEELAQKLRRKKMVNTAILVSLIILAIFGCFLVDFAKKERRLKQLKSEISEIQPMVDLALEERKKFESLREEFEFLRSIRENQRVWLNVLHELYNIIPHDVWVTELTLEEGALKQLRGNALYSASKLVPILEESPYFENVKFRGSIVKGNVKDQPIERFVIGAKITKGRTNPPLPPAKW
jgi:Tfp pilus assembly protein PilN